MDGIISTDDKIKKISALHSNQRSFFLKFSISTRILLTVCYGALLFGTVPSVSYANIDGSTIQVQSGGTLDAGVRCSLTFLVTDKSDDTTNIARHQFYQFTNISPGHAASRVRVSQPSLEMAVVADSCNSLHSNPRNITHTTQNGFLSGSEYFVHQGAGSFADE